MTKTYEKQTKTQVLAHLRKTGKWVGCMVASRCAPRPGHPFNVAVDITLTPEKGKEHLENASAHYQHYNCNKDTGYRVHYYREVSE